MNKKVRLELDKYKKEIEYEQHCNEQLRNKITNLEYKIKRLEEDNKYKEVLDKIKEILGNYKLYSTPDEKQNAENEEIVDKAYKLLEEIE